MFNFRKVFKKSKNSRERELNASGKKAFTVIELLVVIAVIGLLSSIVLVSIKGIREKARRAKADQDLHTILRAVMMAQIQEDEVLGKITGSWCSACFCWSAECDYTCDACKNRMDITMKAIGLGGAIKDPWGRYYGIDENELENPNNPCRKDRIICKGYKIIEVPFYSSQCF